MGTDLPYQINPELTGISLCYRNTDYIADKVLPRTPVARKSFQYLKYPDDAFLSVPNTEIGRTGMPNKIEIKAELVDASVKSHSLEAEVPQEDIEEMQETDADVNIMEDNTNLVTDGLSLAREVRTADLLSNPELYGSNKVVLSGSDQLSDKTSSVIELYKDIKKSMLMAPTHAVVSDTYALYLQTHPDFLGMYKGDNTNNRGLVPLDFIARQLGLKEIFVGKTKANYAKQGQAPRIIDVWGRDLLFIYQNPLARPKQGMTFGFTAEKGKREIQTFYNGRPGSHGVNYIKAVENVNEIISAVSCGYLVKNAFAEN